MRYFYHANGDCILVLKELLYNNPLNTIEVSKLVANTLINSGTKCLTQYTT